MNAQRIRHILTTLCFFAGLSSLSACTQLNKLMQHEQFAPQSEASLQALQAWQQTQAKHADGRSDLLALVASKQAHQLVKQGLANNPNLRHSTLSIGLAQQVLEQSSAEQFPHLNLALSQEKQEHQAINYRSSLSLSWTLDWLGKLEDQVAMQEHAVLMSVAANQYARDLLAAHIMDAWLKLVRLQQRIVIQQQRLQVQESQENSIKERYSKGLSSLRDLDSSRSQANSAHASLVAYQEALHSQKRALALLLGQQSIALDISDSFPEVSVPIARLPAQDLGRRPDLQKAYLAIRRADLNTRIAYKSLLPDLSLNASLDDMSTVFRDSLLSSPAWTLLSKLSAPLFQGGKLRADIRTAEITAQQTYWTYQETLLNAVNEVEDALGKANSLNMQRDHISAALSNAKRNADIYQEQYRLGLASFLELMNAQSQVFDLEDQLSELHYQDLSNRISLGLALGLGVTS